MTLHISNILTICRHHRHYKTIVAATLVLVFKVIFSTNQDIEHKFYQVDVLGKILTLSLLDTSVELNTTFLIQINIPELTLARVKHLQLQAEQIFKRIIQLQAEMFILITHFQKQVRSHSMAHSLIYQAAIILRQSIHLHQ